MTKYLLKAQRLPERRFQCWPTRLALPTMSHVGMSRKGSWQQFKFNTEPQASNLKK